MLELQSEPAVMTVDETAEFLRISRNSAYEAVKSGEIPSIKIGRRILIPRAAVMKMLESGEERANENGEAS